MNPVEFSVLHATNQKDNSISGFGRLENYSNAIKD
jgi:hypothetical protein